MAKSVDRNPMIIPGEYDGLWSAYYVEVLFHNGNRSEKIKMNEGVRGFNIPCKVKVDKDGYLIVY